MSDLYKLGQSQQGSVEKVGEEIRLDIQLDDNPFLNMGTILGTITDNDDKPIEGVLVKIMDNDHNPLYHTLTDAEGKYNLTGLTPGSEYHFYAVKDGYLLKEERGFAIEAGQTIEINSKITPDPNAVLSTITGHTFDTDGNPVENMIATLLKVEQGEQTPVAVTTTNEYGQAVFVNVAIGSYIARVTKQGYETAAIEIQVTEPGSITNIDAVVSTSSTESQGTINGIITDKAGNPIASAVVILYEVTGDEENPELIPFRYTRTSTNGAYLFGEVPKGNYIVKSNKES
ncbi:carboxypeptidase-like regulatory domain-containing protein [Clostridium aestuarii]|uniref:Carboxypeptidase-like regulatory domain-containing protein n=1 Tax=Clostridium aestuarii TaxID=338193 RepID=A0ABT4D369_9CLOT|nr:carboxypeptidase-like regulatory domain-containing protein [Clostridium aestuarii]MCY6484730.1 carboxypeptidase-like regulatory domain-containing protein [Clostridium aestuarii]